MPVDALQSGLDGVSADSKSVRGAASTTCFDTQPLAFIKMNFPKLDFPFPPLTNFLAISGIFLLSACGGGGGELPPQQEPPTAAPTEPPTVQATQVGLLDKTCNGSGKVTLKAGVGASVDVLTAAYGLADGASLLYGNIDRPENKDSIQSAYWSNIKLKPDCSVDSSYGNNGVNFMSVSDPDYQVENLSSVTRLADGTGYVFGTSTQSFAYPDGKLIAWSYTPTFTKLTAAGSLDTAFGIKKSFVKFPADLFPKSLNFLHRKIMADGKILMLAAEGGSVATFALFRFNADGSPDTAFGSDGKFVVDNSKAGGFSPTFKVARLNSIDTQADGKLLISGYFSGLANAPSFVLGVMRLNIDLSIDTSYGKAGVNGLGESGGLEERKIIKVLPDGKSLLFGTGNMGQDTSGIKGFQALTVTRLLANGEIDLTFGTAGVTRIDFDSGRFAPDNSNVVILRAATVMPDGKILMAGDSYNLDAAAGAPEKLRHIGVVRLLANGTLDKNFATGGIFSGLETSNAANEIVNSITLTDDGKVVVGATREISQGDSDWVMYRFTN